MALIVQKYGGSSLGTLEKVRYVAEKIKKTQRAGHSVVVVLSAMGDETDRLQQLANSVTGMPEPRDLDMLLSTGEQVSISVMSMILNDIDVKAQPFKGGQVPIITDEIHSKARIIDIKPDNLLTILSEGYVPVVAGFQGIDKQGNVTTLGRGGSDTTAVALAAALNADECQIYTDVDGVYTTDPRMVEGAKLLPKITFEEMLELSSLGAKVLQIRAVEFAGRYKVPLRVLNTFNEDGKGTLIALEDMDMEHPLVSGIAFNRDEAKLTILGVPDRPGVASMILGPVSGANIEVDMIIQNVAKDGTTDFTFTVHRNDFEKALEILKKVGGEVGARDINGDNKIAKISIVGVGMRSHAGIASTMFKTLGSEGINIQMISTSEIKVSVVVDEKYLELTVRAIHSAFGLAEPPEEEKL